MAILTYIDLLLVFIVLTILHFLYFSSITSYFFPYSITNASTGMNGIGISSSSSAPTAMYRPNFTQAFQRTGPYPLFPGTAPFSSSGVVSNGEYKECVQM